jgi:hypothetical protein
MASQNSPNPHFLEALRAMMKRFFVWLRKEVDSYEQPNDFNVDDFILRHNTWSITKKATYLASMWKQFLQPVRNNYFGAFHVRVKNGEEQLTEMEKIEKCIINGDFQLLDEESRPRAISMGSRQINGSLTWWQGVDIMKVMRAVLPGFIQKYGCDALTAHLTPHTRSLGTIAISFDGKAFDSNQHKEIQEIVDLPIFDIFRDRLRIILQSILSNPAISQNVDSIIEQLRAFWMNLKADWFIVLPGISKFHRMSEQEIQLYKRCWNDLDWKECIHFVLSGTTFSGHPTLTTLGNTLSSLAYLWFCLEMCKYYDPWKNTDTFAGAAGDDSFAEIPEKSEDDFTSSLKKVFASTKEIPNHGLGQCIGDYKIMISDGKNIDFCSKWCFVDEQLWFLTRDYQKTLWNKQQYSGTNSEMMIDPRLQPYAMLNGLKSEGLEGGYLYSIMEYRVYMWCNVPLSNKKQDSTLQSWKKDHQYEAVYHQPLTPSVVKAIDEKLGLNELTWIALVNERTVTYES